MNTSSATFIVSAPDLASCPTDTLPEFAFAGRSNVGKSSLLNLLVGKRDLAKVSATPGHTKHINLFLVNGCWRLVDLPGYGYAHAGWQERTRFAETVSDYLANRPNLKCVFALIDSSIEVQESDLEFTTWLAANGIPFALVFTKADKVGEAKLKEQIAAFRGQLEQRCGVSPQFLSTSSINRFGRTALLGVINPLLGREHRRPHRAPPPPRKTPW